MAERLPEIAFVHHQFPAVGSLIERVFRPHPTTRRNARLLGGGAHFASCSQSAAALKIIEPRPHCFTLANQVLLRAKEYGDIWVLGAADPFSIAEAALNEALKLLVVEMKYFAAASPMDRIVATVLLDKLTPDSMWSKVVVTEAGF